MKKRLHGSDSSVAFIKLVRKNEFLYLGQNITSKIIEYNGEKISIIQAYKELYEIFFSIKSTLKLNTNHIN